MGLLSEIELHIYSNTSDRACAKGHTDAELHPFQGVHGQWAEDRQPFVPETPTRYDPELVKLRGPYHRK